MIDKLGNLGALNESSDKANKINKKIKVRNNDVRFDKKAKNKTAASTGVGDAQVKISESAKELMKLRAEAERYLKMMEDKETLSAEDLKDIQAKLKTDHYLREEVIDKIIDKLVNLPGFKNL